METYRKEQPSHVPYRIKPGDPIFYKWNATGTWGHAGIVTRAHGVDPNPGWVGTLVSSHSVNRKWAIWHLKPYNQTWKKTQTAEFHVDS